MNDDVAGAVALAGLDLTRDRIAGIAPLVRAMTRAALALVALDLTEPPSGPDSAP